VGGQLDVHRRVNQRLLAPVHLRHDGGHILQVAFGRDRLLEVLGAAALHPVFVGRVADDLLFFKRGYMAGIDVQRHAILFSKVAQDRLFFRGGRVFPQRPHTAESVAANEVVGTEFNDGGCDHIEEFLNTGVSSRGGALVFGCFAIGHSSFPN
jgi:hypothetical protein